MPLTLMQRMEQERESPPPGNQAQLTGLPAPQDDGTRQLLRAGASTLAAGILAALLTRFVFGGIGREGAHTNSGWLSLLVALMCLPFGSLLFALGLAKWSRNRSRQRPR